MTSGSDHGDDWSDLAAELGLESTQPELTAAEVARAEKTLRSILDTPRETSLTPARPRLVVVACSATVLVGIVAVIIVVLGPWAQTPTAPSVTFSQPARLAQLDLSPTTQSSMQVMRELGMRAAIQAGPSTAPIDHIATSAWTAAHDQVLNTDLYAFPDGSSRSIVRSSTRLSESGTIVPRGTTRIVRDSRASAPRDNLADSPASSVGPEEVRADLARLAGCQHVDSRCVVAGFVAVHQSRVIPPVEAARMWDALADVAEITALGTGTDRLGRSVTALELEPTSAGERLIVLAGTDSGQFLGTETVAVDGQVLAFTLVEDAERVSLAGAPH